MDRAKIKKLLEKGKNIVFLGAPGSGKGTYAKRLGPFLNIPHISSGDIIRETIQSGGEHSKQLNETISRGEFVDDEFLFSKIIKSRFEKKDAKNGFILDGKLSQVHLLDDICKVNLALEISIPEHIIIGKILARRACVKCNEQYNLYSIDDGTYKMPPLLPKIEGKCDKCGSALITRSDDNIEVIEKRLQLYKESHCEIAAEYEKRGVLQKFNLTLGVKEMWPVLRGYFEHL